MNESKLYLFFVTSTKKYISWYAAEFQQFMCATRWERLKITDLVRQIGLKIQIDENPSLFRRIKKRYRVELFICRSYSLRLIKPFSKDHGKHTVVHRGIFSCHSQGDCMPEGAVPSHQTKEKRAIIGLVTFIFALIG